MIGCCSIFHYCEQASVGFIIRCNSRDMGKESQKGKILQGQNLLFRQSWQFQNYMIITFQIIDLKEREKWKVSNISLRIFLLMSEILDPLNIQIYRLDFFSTSKSVHLRKVFA